MTTKSNPAGRGMLMLIALAFATISLHAQEAPWMRNRVVSPEIHEDNSVTFRIFAPDIDKASVSGSWMAGWGATEDLVRNDTGLWTLTTGPLEPEIYTYSFRLDGITMLDPANIRVMRDGARHASMLLVPGAASELYQVQHVPHGTLSKVWYESPTLELTRRMYVYTPPGYESGSETYPVFYLLHGGGGDEDAWATLGRACQIMDNLIAQGKARPMIVVITPAEGETTSSGVLWSNPDAPTSNPSPLLYEGLLYLVSNRGGEITCLDAANGDLVYQEKIDNVAACWASPWAHEDKIFFTDEKGVTQVLKAGRDFEVLHQNVLEDKVWASVAVTKDAYLLKGTGQIYCIAD
jgi:outer membrane protein assembly factor BamB